MCALCHEKENPVRCAHMHPLWEKAETLVKERIKGHRKGIPDEPSFKHSFRVAERLRQEKQKEEVVLAGLLHDVVEDGDVSLKELRKEGFSPRIVELVDLCSHDRTIKSSDGRWVVMMARLVKAQDKEAWAIKIADITDNLAESASMSPDRAKFMRTVKVPLLLAISHAYAGKEKGWKQLRAQITF